MTEPPAQAPQRRSSLVAREDRDRTLAAFRILMTKRAESSYLSSAERAEEGIPTDAPERIPVTGVPPGHVMAMRWCTMLDAMHEIGRVVYGTAWISSMFDDKPHFPYSRRHIGFVFRAVALSENGEPGEDLLGAPDNGSDAIDSSTAQEEEGEGEDISGIEDSECSRRLLELTGCGEDAIEHGTDDGPHDPPLVTMSSPVRDSSWDKALGAYVILFEALAEGLVLAVAESITSVRVPDLDGQARGSVGPRARVPIDAVEWRRDGVIFAEGLTRAWWSIRHGNLPREPPWVVLVDRETVATFLDGIRGELTEDATTEEVRRGRKRDISLDLVRDAILQRWHDGELGPKKADVTREIQQVFDVPRGTADQWRRDLGIRKGGEHENRACDTENGVPPISVSPDSSS
ncbi:MAG: hypothetical protein H6712_31325 [Myxococcales bacterium]|nr:hypothetical protein [Myxococcales bacterium]